VEREPSAATALLGLSGFALPAVSGYDGELEQAVETTANLVGCPGRSAVTTPHAAPGAVCDLPNAGRRVTPTWVKRVGRCRHRECDDDLDGEFGGDRAGGVVDRARRARAALRVGQDGESVAAAAPEFGVGWGTVMAAVCDHATAGRRPSPARGGCAGAGWTRPRSPPRPPPARRRSSPGSST
jgi:transposase